MTPEFCHGMGRRPAAHARAGWRGGLGCHVASAVRAASGPASTGDLGDEAAPRWFRGAVGVHQPEPILTAAR